MGGPDTSAGWAAVPRVSMLAAAAALIGLTVLLYLPDQTRWLRHAEHSSADLRTALFSHQIVGDHPRVAVVTITDASLPTSPIDRQFLADLIKAVDGAGAHAIGLDVFFRRPTDPAKDRALIETLRNARAKVVLAAWDERGMTDPGQQAYQRNFIAQTRRPSGYVNTQEEDDGVVRYSAPPHPGSLYTDSFALALARTMEPGLAPRYERIAWLRQVESSNPLGWLVNLEGTSPFVERTAVEMLDPGKKAENTAALAGRIVLIGADLALADQWRIPLTAWTKRSTAGVLIHAQQVAQLLDGRSVVELGSGSRSARLVLLGLAIAGGLAGWRFRNRKFDFLSWGAATVMLICLDAVLFKTLHVILPFLMSLLAWFCGVTAGHHLGFIQDWALSNRKAVA